MHFVAGQKKKPGMLKSEAENFLVTVWEERKQSQNPTLWETDSSERATAMTTHNMIMQDSGIKMDLNIS